MAENARVIDSKGTPLGADVVKAWVEEHGDYLYRYCLRHFRDAASAEDLVQETFLAAVRSHESFAGKSAARTWLTSILRNKIIDRIRQQGRHRELSLDALEADKLSHFFDDAEHWRADAGPREWGLDPEQAFQSREFMGVLESCLSKLPEKLRSIFLLREIEDLSREQISEQLSLTATNIGVILHRARLQLRVCLQLNWLEEKKS